MAEENAPAATIPSAPSSSAIESDDPFRTSSSVSARISAVIGNYQPLKIFIVNLRSCPRNADRYDLLDRRNLRRLVHR